MSYETINTIKISKMLSCTPEFEPVEEVLESKTPGDEADNGGGVVINVTIERLPFSFSSCSTLYK